MLGNFFSKMHGATKKIHQTVDKHPLLAGFRRENTFSIKMYHDYLSQHYALYLAVDLQLEKLKDKPPVNALLAMKVYADLAARTSRILKDLESIEERYKFSRRKPVTATSKYCNEVKIFDPKAIFALYCMRAFGDLFGGQTKLTRFLGYKERGPQAVNFYQFKGDVRAARNELKLCFNAVSVNDRSAMINTIQRAFQFHLHFFNEVYKRNAASAEVAPGLSGAAPSGHAP